MLQEGQYEITVAALEDKIVQRAVTGVLNAVYETDFLGFSYGFRPGRSPHDALDALAAGIYKKKVNWVLDADIRDFFTSLDQGWLERLLGHRIADKRVLRLIGKWLGAGVIENGTCVRVRPLLSDGVRPDVTAGMGGVCALSCWSCPAVGGWWPAGLGVRLPR